VFVRRMMMGGRARARKRGMRRYRETILAVGASRGDGQMEEVWGGGGVRRGKVRERGEE